MPGLDPPPEVPMEAFAGAGGARGSPPGHLKAREAGSLSPASSRLPARARHMRGHGIRKAPQCYQLSPAGMGQQAFTPEQRLPLQGQAIHGHQVVPLETAGMLILDKLAPRWALSPAVCEDQKGALPVTATSAPFRSLTRGQSPWW